MPQSEPMEYRILSDDPRVLRQVVRALQTTIRRGEPHDKAASVALGTSWARCVQYLAGRGLKHYMVPQMPYNWDGNVAAARRLAGGSMSRKDVRSVAKEARRLARWLDSWERASISEVERVAEYALSTVKRLDEMFAQMIDVVCGSDSPSVEEVQTLMGAAEDLSSDMTLASKSMSTVRPAARTSPKWLFENDLPHCVLSVTSVMDIMLGRGKKYDVGGSSSLSLKNVIEDSGARVRSVAGELSTCFVLCAFNAADPLIRMTDLPESVVEEWKSSGPLRGTVVLEHGEPCPTARQWLVDHHSDAGVESWNRVLDVAAELSEISARES